MKGKGDEGVGARQRHGPADQGPNHVTVERRSKRNTEVQSPKCVPRDEWRRYDRNAPREQADDEHPHQEWGNARGEVKEEKGAPGRKERSARAKSRHLRKGG